MLEQEVNSAVRLEKSVMLRNIQYDVARPAGWGDAELQALSALT